VFHADIAAFSSTSGIVFYSSEPTWAAKLVTLTRMEVERQMYLEGQRRWPLVRLDFAAFREHCERVLGAEPYDEAPTDGADLYLCCACARGDREAVHAFEREGLPVARAAVARVARSADFLQEVLQEVWDKLLVGPQAKVLKYSGKGPLQAWVRVVATRLALDHSRARGALAARRAELSDQLAARDPSPEVRMTRARYGLEFQKALRKAVSGLSVEARNVLRMHVVGQCSIDEIGRAYNVHRATAARWLERARTQIYENVKKDLNIGGTGMNDSEFKSLARVMGSELSLSLSAGSLREKRTLERAPR